MKIKLTWFLSFLFFFQTIAWTQNQTKIRALVVDEHNRAISNAHVSLVHAYIGTITNQQGYFEINIHKNHLSDTLRIGHISFQPIYLSISQISVNNELLVIPMIINDYTLNEITIDEKENTAKDILHKATESLLTNYHQNPAVLEVYYFNSEWKKHTDDTITYRRGIETILLVTDENKQKITKKNFRNHEKGSILQNKVSKEWEVPVDNWPGANKVRHLFKQNNYKYIQHFPIGKDEFKQFRVEFSHEIYSPDMFIVEFKTRDKAMVRFYIKKTDFKIMRFERITNPTTTSKSITRAITKNAYWLHHDTTIVEFQEIKNETFLKSIYSASHSEHRLHENDSITFRCTDIDHIIVTGIRENTGKLPDEGIKTNLSKSFYSNEENTTDWDKLNKYIRFVPDAILPDSIKSVLQEMWKEQE